MSKHEACASKGCWAVSGDKLIRRCVVCGDPVCGFHSVMVGGRASCIYCVGPACDAYKERMLQTASMKEHSRRVVTIAAKKGGMYEEMASKIGNRVKCTTCGREQTVDSAKCLRHGWPKCCGYTMRLLSKEADDGEET